MKSRNITRERYSIAYFKTKTWGKYQWDIKVKPKPREAQENAGDQVVIGFSLVTD